MASLEVQASLAVSDAPSWFGEKVAGAVGPMAGGVASTRTLHDRLTRLPAASEATSCRRQMPSGATAPAAVRPSHATAMLPPEPVRTRIGLPTVEPVTGATPNAQVVAPPDVPSATRTVSRTPSPFGEITPP